MKERRRSRIFYSAFCVDTEDKRVLGWGACISDSLKMVILDKFIRLDVDFEKSKGENESQRERESETQYF